MQPLVLAGSSSQTRLSHYQQTLDGYGVTAVPLAIGADGFQELALYPGAALLLECSMVWGASSNGGEECFDETRWSDVPLILFVSSDHFDRAGEEMRIPIYGLFQQFPSREELISAIECARVSSAPFRALKESDTPRGTTMRRSNLEQDTFHSCRERN
jgi:hypothetical protein